MTLRIGLIGCGGITRAHVEGWKGVADKAQIVAVADVSEDAITERVAQIGHEVDIYSDFNDLLAKANVDAVDLALPHHLHRDAIVAAAKAGKHLMTEKPLCLDMEEAADIAKAVKESGIIMMAAHNQLFFPSVLQAKQMLQNGDLGEIYMIRSYDCSARRQSLSLDKSQWGVEQARPFTWRSDPELMGGGQLIDTGYHPTYRLLFLAGEKKPAEVTAMLGTYRLPLQREDTSEVMVKFDNGMMGHIFTSWAMRNPGVRPLLFSIMGEAGQLWGEIDRIHYQPVGFQTPATIEYPGWNYGQSFAAEIEHFVEAIEGGYEPLHSVTEATETLRVIMGAYEAVEKKAIVTL